MRRKGRPKKQKTDKAVKIPGKRGRPRKRELNEDEPPLKKAKRGRPRTIKIEQDTHDNPSDPLEIGPTPLNESQSSTSNEQNPNPDDNFSEGLHMSTMQIRALSSLVACLDCGEEIALGVRSTTKGMISEFTVSCKVCGSQKSTNTPNLIRERKRKREKKGVTLQKNENINYAHVAAFLDNGLGYSGLRHYCKYFNSRCLNEATFIVYAKQVIADVVSETEDFLQQNARIVRKAFETQHDSDYIIDLTVGYTTTYHQWGSDFCLVAGAVIELQTGLVLDYDVGNMYCHVCKINAKKIVSMSPSEMTDWFNKHQDTCEIREWCDEIDQDSEEGIKEIDPKYLEAFIAKKIWMRSLEKFGFRYTTLIHESDERIHSELLKAAPYGDLPVIIDNITNCFSRRKSEHARTSFQNKLKAKCPRERVQTKDRILYVYAMSIPEYNKFAIGSNIKLRELVRRMEIEEEEYQYTTELTIQASEIIPVLQEEQDMMDQKSVGDAFEVEKEVDEEGEGEEGEGEGEGEGGEEGGEGGEEGEGEEEEEEEETGEVVEEDEDEEGEGAEDELLDSQDIEVLEEEEEDEEEDGEYEEVEEDEEEEEEEEDMEVDPPPSQKEVSHSKNIIQKEERKIEQKETIAATTTKGNEAKPNEKPQHKLIPNKKDTELNTKKQNSEVKKIIPTPVQDKPSVVPVIKPSSSFESTKPKSNPKPVPETTTEKKVSIPDTKVASTSQQKPVSSTGDKKNVASAPIEKKPVSVEAKVTTAARSEVKVNKPVSQTKVIIGGSKKISVSSEQKTSSASSSSTPGVEPKKIMVMTSGKKPSHSSGNNTLVKKTVSSEGHNKEHIRKIVTSTSKPISSAPPKMVSSTENTKVKSAMVEKRSEVRPHTVAVIRKDSTAGMFEKGKEVAKPAKPLSQNGTEDAKVRPPKQTEVVKPFRVDFGED